MKDKTITYIHLLTLFVAGIVIGVLIGISYCQLSSNKGNGQIIPNTVKVRNLHTANK